MKAQKSHIKHKRSSVQRGPHMLRNSAKLNDPLLEIKQQRKPSNPKPKKCKKQST